MIKIIARRVVRAEDIDKYETLARELVEKSQAEAGNVSYTLNKSIADPKVCTLVRAVMRQSGEGLIKKFGFNHEVHYAYIERIIKRFSNPYLRDDVDRVGREPLRKLAPNDRLILPMMTAKSYGLSYDKILLAIGAALRFNNGMDPQSIEMLSSIEVLGLEGTIVKYTGIPAGDPLVGEIVDAYHEVEKF